MRLIRMISRPGGTAGETTGIDEDAFLFEPFAEPEGQHQVADVDRQDGGRGIAEIEPERFEAEFHPFGVVPEVRDPLRFLIMISRAASTAAAFAGLMLALKMSAREWCFR
jgi:hypothetical protein